MSRRPTWQQIYQRFDPELESVPSAWRADRERSPARAIRNALDRPPARSQPHILLAGTMGTGKTTELLRLAEERARGGEEFVVVVDLVRHFHDVVGDVEALQHIASWEVCFLAGVALLRAAEEQLGYRFTPEQIKGLEQAWAAAAKAAKTEPAVPSIDVSGLARSMVLLASEAAAPGSTVVAAGLKLLGSTAGSVKWAIPFGRRDARPLADQDATVQNLLASVNLLIGTFQHWGSRRVLFVIDGLDRIRDFERARALFLESEMIGRLVCPLVVATPFALRHHMAVSTVRGFTQVCTLVNEPVLLKEDPQRYGPGVGFFCEVYRKRVSDLDAEGLIPEPLLERLAYYSGGRARDFVRWIGMLAERAWDEDADAATETLCEQVIDEARRLMEIGLDRGLIDVLEAVVRDPERQPPGDGRVRDLLNYGRLLPYPNESEWYYPHPLLTLHLVKGTGSSGSHAS